MSTFKDLVLQTPRLVLRPMVQVDAETVFRIFTDAKFMQYVASPPFASMAQAHDLVTRDMNAMASGERLRLGLERADNGAVIGTCTLFNFDKASRKAELGYGLLGSACGQGYMREALVALLQYGFDTLNLHRIHAEIDPVNTDSTKILQRLGFAKEGVLREDCLLHGVHSDSAIYGLLQREWRAG